MFIQITDSMDREVLINSEHIVKIIQAKPIELNITYIYLSNNEMIQAKCSYDNFKKYCKNMNNFYKI